VREEPEGVIGGRMGTPNMSPMVIRIKRCSMLERVLRACLAMPWVAENIRTKITIIAITFFIFISFTLFYFSSLYI